MGTVSRDEFERSAPWLLIGIPLASAGAFLLLGAGYVLDDWYVLRNAQFDGAWAAGGDETGLARPGSIVVFALVFGIFEQHPLVPILLMAVVSSLSGLLLHRLLRELLPAAPAAVASVLWVLLPTHLSTEVWITCSIISTSLLLLLVALNLGLTPVTWGRAAAVAALVAASVLTYEASLPAAGAAVLAVPWLIRGRPDWQCTLAGWAGGGAAALWILTHWYEGKRVQPWADPAGLLEANFGWGVTPAGLRGLSPLLCGAAVALVVLAVVRTTFPSFSPGEEDRWVLAGAAVLVLGFLPFVRYFYAPLGAGDRANYLSAIGGALIWTAALRMAARRIEAAGPVLLLAVALLAVWARWERLELWSTAGRDADAITAAAVAQIPNPDGQIVLGPTPVIRDNVAAFLDASNLDGALAIAYGDTDVRSGISYDPEVFETIDPRLRLDAPRLSELDDVDLWLDDDD